MDLNFYIRYINRAGIKKLGYKPKELIGHARVTDLLIQSDKIKFIKHVSIKVEEDLEYSQEYTIVHKNGFTFPIILFLSPIIRINELFGYRLIGLDISK